VAHRGHPNARAQRGPSETDRELFIPTSETQNPCASLV
jgi:hypothetical protein